MKSRPAGAPNVGETHVDMMVAVGFLIAHSDPYLKRLWDLAGLMSSLRKVPDP